MGAKNKHGVYKEKLSMKIGRNDPCPCGSGKKYKKCCMDKPQPIINFEAIKAAELIRTQQQGHGRPIISSEIKGRRVVVAGNTVYHSQKWRTFPDFLADYIKSVLGTEWENKEIAKPLRERHTVLQWCDEYYRYQKSYDLTPGNIRSTPMSGTVYCYLGLSYNLYLLKHNVELQRLMVNRIKDQKNFQGAYYELLVANALIRAGFELVLEDETDRNNKHCEYAAISKKTGKRYWVEAKMRAVKGYFGKTEKDGTTSTDPTSELIRHLNKALKKQSGRQRIIFIDLNAEHQGPEEPIWVKTVESKLSRREKILEKGQSAYVFVTNLPFHRSLRSEDQGRVAMAYGLGILDFAKPGRYRVSQMYRQKQKHIDVHNIMETLKTYPGLPSTFDGSLPSKLRKESYGRVLIGETYFFEGIGKHGEGEALTVTSATVSEQEKLAYIGTSNGKILTWPMTDEAMEDYKDHPEAFFGKIQTPSGKETNTPLELFEFFLETYKKTSKEKLLGFMKDAQDYSSLERMSQPDLAIEYCERICETAIRKQKK